MKPDPETLNVSGAVTWDRQAIAQDPQGTVIAVFRRSVSARSRAVRQPRDCRTPQPGSHRRHPVCRGRRPPHKRVSTSPCSYPWTSLPPVADLVNLIPPKTVETLTPA